LEFLQHLALVAFRLSTLSWLVVAVVVSNKVAVVELAVY
jgi:hypothetical protein